MILLFCFYKRINDRIFFEFLEGPRVNIAVVIVSRAKIQVQDN